MAAARAQDADGIRVNGVVTPYADAELYAHLLPLPPKERARALKQLAMIGLLVTRGRMQVSMAAAMPAVAEPVPVAAPVVAPGPVHKEEDGVSPCSPPAPPAAPSPSLPATPAPVADPAVEPGAGSYDLAGLDLADIELSF